MTISNTSRTAGPFTGNGVITAFPFAYKVFARADVMVARTVTATGVETLLVLDSDYTVTLNADQNASPGGTITMLVAPPTGTTLAATSNLQIQQALDLTNNGGFYPKAINDALDRVVIFIQQLNARVGLGALNVGAAATIASILSTLTTLAGSTGSTLIGFIQAGTDAVLRTMQAKARERVSVADFLTTATPTAAQATAAFQSAVNSGARKVFVTADYTVNATIALVANQVIDFDGGSLIVANGATVPNGVLYGLNKANIRIIDPVIDATAVAVGETAINLKDCPGGRIDLGTLTKANLVLQATSNAARMGYKVRGMVINLAGWATTGCYVSAANGVNLTDMEIFNGKEGVGIYNDARAVKHAQISSYGHTQDGFVIIAGQRIEYSGCMAYNNAQSGFTTQRQTAAENTRRISYAGCHAYDNTYDGFDLRGANSAAFAVDMMMTLSSCVASGNSGTGFYIVYAEGTTLTGCVATLNSSANFRIDTSLRTQLHACRSVSGANAVGAGTAKAGIDIYNSNNVSVAGCISSNEAGATQSYGISFTGTSAGGQVTGGYYENNAVAPFYLGSGAGNRMVGAQANTLAGSGVWTKEVTFLGLYNEEGNGVPTHSRPKGSNFIRIDGAGAEQYKCNGGTSWTIY